MALLTSKEPASHLRRPSQSPAGAVGNAGEDAAAEHLARLGWRILDRNWRSVHLELDIIAEEGDTLVFVEVKTRRAGGMQSPWECLTPAKRARLRRAAKAWLSSHGCWHRPCRIDLACVTAEQDRYTTELIRNAVDYGEQDPRNPLGGRNASWQPW